MELKNYNAILAPLIYQKCLAAVVVKQKKKKDFLFNHLIKIIHISFFYSFFYSKTCCAPQSLWSLFLFFSSSHQALSSLIKLIIPPISLISPHLSSSSHLHSTPKPKPLPSPAPAPAVAVPRRQLSPLCLTAAGPPTSLTNFAEASCWPIFQPCRHRPTSQPLLLLAAHAVPAHASAHARRRRQPTSGQCSLFISS